MIRSGGGAGAPRELNTFLLRYSLPSIVRNVLVHLSIGFTTMRDIENLNRYSESTRHIYNDRAKETWTLGKYMIVSLQPSSKIPHFTFRLLTAEYDRSKSQILNPSVSPQDGSSYVFCRKIRVRDSSLLKRASFTMDRETLKRPARPT